MDHTCSVNHLCFPGSVLNWSVLTLAGLVSSCNPGQSADMERVQAANIRRTKVLHAAINHHDWQAAEGLCAETIRYRGWDANFADVDESRTQCLNHYRTGLNAGKQGSVAIRQLTPPGVTRSLLKGNHPTLRCRSA